MLFSINFYSYQLHIKTGFFYHLVDTRTVF